MIYNRRMIVPAALVAVLLLVGGAYCQGKKAGSVEARRQAATVKTAAAVAQVAPAKAAAKEARSLSEGAAVSRRAARRKVVLKGDTAVVGDTSQVLLPEVAALIRTDDVKIEADSVSMVRQDTVIAKLDAVVVAQKAELKIADEGKRPRCGAKCGAALTGVAAIALFFALK